MIHRRLVTISETAVFKQKPFVWTSKQNVQRHQACRAQAIVRVWTFHILMGFNTESITSTLCNLAELFGRISLWDSHQTYALMWWRPSEGCHLVGLPHEVNKIAVSITAIFSGSSLEIFSWEMMDYTNTLSRWLLHRRFSSVYLFDQESKTKKYLLAWSQQIRVFV